jgi:hypothetical protein
MAERLYKPFAKRLMGSVDDKGNTGTVPLYKAAMELI